MRRKKRREDRRCVRYKKKNRCIFRFVILFLTGIGQHPH